MSKTKKNTILGYRNLDIVHEKLKSLLIRRTRKAVFESPPEIIENTYYLDLADEQAEIHQGYMYSLLRIINKKFLTPMDVKMIPRILTGMRMVCDSTYLIDKQSNTSPKLVELVSILNEIVIEDRRKVIIFTEWTTMTYLIGKVLSELSIDSVEFRNNPDCMVFLSTDAGGGRQGNRRGRAAIQVVITAGPTDRNVIHEAQILRHQPLRRYAIGATLTPAGRSWTGDGGAA